MFCMLIGSFCNMMAVINMEMSFVQQFSSYGKICYGVKNVSGVFIENLCEVQQKNERINTRMCQEMAVKFYTDRPCKVSKC